ncbi:hypothetical protein [Streptomyces antimycoticus]|uniref:hypothetical protein n=1 Tax=Streptomyces antimycoticus TaxID=68175 RepID=UPI001F282057|nr:hypothetical protein [Streptomyces antimycoticus]
MEFEDSTINSSPRRSVAAPRPVRSASKPAGVTDPSLCDHPGPNNTSISRNSTASSTRDNASTCRRSPACCARYIGITQHSRPVAHPAAFVVAIELSTPRSRSCGSTVCATRDVFSPSHRPNSPARITVL